MRAAAKMLLQTNDSIMDIGEKCGFSSNSYFGKVFRESLGCTPKEYREKF
ncbi:helix-turn-helix transcriptional regulator [Muricomes intestini]|nr:helix-turn-helix transcriptional regulator [Muricomes intestini]